jgi:lysyl-tRNA synthetase class 2
MSEADIRAERLKKLENLRAAGVDPYPARVERTCEIAELLNDFYTHEEKKTTVTIVGRVMALRGQGGIIFADIFDGSTSFDKAQDKSLTTGGPAHSTSSGQGKMQVVVQKGEMTDEDLDLFEKNVDIGDFIQVTGTPFKTKRGERSIQAADWKMAAKSLLPIPDQWFGLKDEEKRLRERISIYFSIQNCAR